ncbi:MAG: hypothetical protein E4G96_07895 [Chrysiogenales bacterium]|nr:MAG: hypothetical protein E4G96_07895 [Chrysiogenales bacterium]
MKKIGLLLILSALVISFGITDGFAFKLGGQEMVRNGSGNRTKSIFGTLYYATLWLPASLQGKSGSQIIDANQPMMMVLTLDSGLITRERFVEATSEGFGKAEAAGYSTPKKKAFLDQFGKVKFSKGDVISLTYANGALSTSIRFKADGKKESLGAIAGLDLKKALFAIWLGPKPIQESLKKSLLAGK